MTIELLKKRFTVCKVSKLDPAFLDAPFCFVGKTDRELSLVCLTSDTPSETLAREDGWRCMRIAGQLEFSLVGILSKISGLLADAGISIFAVSTYDTDYILLKEDTLEAALYALGKDYSVILAE